MPLWSEIKSYLRRTFTIAVDEPEWIGLAWILESPGGDDVVQKQRVELVQAFGQPHIMIWSDVTEVERVPPRTALAHNMTLAIGAVAINEQHYVLRAVLPLDPLDWDYLEKTMRHVAHEAARLRVTTALAIDSPTARPLGLFGHYA
jgi:hypothetical protein